MPVCRFDRPPQERWGRFFLLAWFLLALIAAPMPRAAAQEQGAELPAVSGAEIDALLATLEDPAARERLIQQLQALKALQAPERQTVEPEGLGAILLSSLSERVRKVSDALVTTATAVLDLPETMRWTADELAKPEVRGRWLEVLLKIGILLLVALTAEWLTARLLNRPRRLLEARSVDRMWLRLPLACARLVLELAPIVVFIAFAYGVLPMTKPSTVTRLVALTIINAHVIARVVVAVARVVLSPKATRLRLPAITDETANYVLIWVRRLTAISVYGYFLAEAGFLLGLPEGIHGFLLRAVGLFVAGMLVVFILQNKTAITRWLKGESESVSWSGPRQRIAEIWHFLAVGYVLAIYGVWALDIAGGFRFLIEATALTVVVVALVRLVTTTLRRVVERGFALSAELKARFPGLEARANRYLPFLQTLLRGVVYVFATLSLLEIWGLDAFGWLTSGFGRRLFGSLVTIAVILLIAVLLSEAVNELVERYMQRRQTRWQEDAARSARMRTLLPLLRNAFRIVLVVMVALIVLSELGINIAPLLAGAGVVGLAVGFGAQTLVKDVITGVFILIEDTIAVGDVVDLDGHSGVVEAMTIRSIRLRDGAGAVHTIPFSAVATVTNMTKDFSYAVFDVAVGYREDIDNVMAVIREVGADLQADPRFQRSILESIEVMGLDQFGDFAVKVKARIKTRPMRQWDVAREFNRRMKRAFDAKGIEMPGPDRTIHHRRDQPGAGASPAPIRTATD